MVGLGVQINKVWNYMLIKCSFELINYIHIFNNSGEYGRKEFCEEIFFVEFQ